MRIIRFIVSVNGETRTLLGEDHQDGTATLLTGSISNSLARTHDRCAVTKLLAPIAPTGIICVGRNYRAPTAASVSTKTRDEQSCSNTRPSDGETDRAQSHDPHPDHTLEVFLKPSTAIQHPGDPIHIPRFDGLDPRLDCEGELAVIIGREARNVSEADALSHVFGYTIANDVTARHFQTPTGPPLWMRGKGFDTFCPLGPAIVTADEIPDPQALMIRTIINSQVVREGSTSDMIRSVLQIIAALSRHMTLLPGAVILTGAPPALSDASPPLRPGDRIAIEIERIGRLENTVSLP